MSLSIDEDASWEFLIGGGEAARLIAAFDWTRTPIGSIDRWHPSLKFATALMLRSPVPMVLLWGEEGVMLYNDAYSVFAGERHPELLGSEVRKGWPEVVAFNDNVMRVGLAGGTLSYRDQELTLYRHGFAEQVWMDLDYSPVLDERGVPAGVICILSDTTERVLAERKQKSAEALLRESEARLAFLDRLNAETAELSSADSVLEATTRLLGEHLDVSVCAYADMDQDEDGFTIRGDWAAPGSKSIVGHYRLADFGKLAVANLTAGQLLVVNDNLNELDPQEAATFQNIGIASTICMPLLKQGRLTALMAIHDRVPRVWTEAELNLLREVTARSWAHVERVAAAAELRSSETRFRNMADSAPVMMWVTNPSGYCTHLNKRWYEFTGQEQGGGEAYGWLDAVHPEDRPLAEQAFVSANLERRDYRVDFRLRRGDGVYRWTIDAAASRFSDEGEFLGYVGSVIDIDERRETEERLALSEEQLRLATEVAEIGHWDVDVVTGALFWPARVKAMFGISPDVPVAMADFFNGVHPEDREPTRAAYEAACDPSRRDLYDVEYRTVGKEDGVIRWVAAKGRGLFTTDGVCTRMIGTAVDVSARKSAELRLLELNEQLEQRVAEQTAERNRVWEMSRDLFAIVGFDGLLKAINPAWESTLGRDTATLLSLSFRERVHPDDLAAVQSMMTRLLEGESVARFENRLLHADGSWRWISWTLVPEGDVFYAVGRDVTLEKAASAELELAQEALRQAQKMEAMGQLTGGVAHDFNNLLTPIIGSLDMLTRRGIGSERERRSIEGALQSAERAKTLVQRLLAFARRQPLQPTSVDVGQLVHSMIGLISSTLGPMIEVHVELDPGCPPAIADANQLEMALLNLAVNSRDAMPDGGKLMIAARCETISRLDPLGLRAGQYVILGVVDTGVGMDEATRQRAIEPFFSTKGVGKGTGLGLSMAHGLAAQLGGGLRIASSLGEGTAIELWLPVSNVAGIIDEPSVATYTTRAARGVALLVDDDELVRMSTADMLIDLGFEVLEAVTAEEALQLIRMGVSPDVLVTDHLMPGMTGADLAREARALLPLLPILIMSGYAEVEGIAPDLTRLAKPFRNIELEAKLAALMPVAL